MQIATQVWLHIRIIMLLLVLTEKPVTNAPVSHVYAMNAAVTSGEIDNEMKVAISQDVKLAESAY